MINHDQAINRAKFIVADLLKNNPTNQVKDIYVSNYNHESGIKKYSIRVNSIDNRINDLDLTLLFFVLDELVNRDYQVTPGGLKISSRKAEIFWPMHTGIQLKFYKFSKLKTIATNDTRKSILISECQDWARAL